LVGLAFGVVAAFSLSRREFGWLKERTFWRGMLVALVMAAPWHAHQFITHGERFLQDYGARHFLQFFDRIPGENTPGPPFDYYFQFLLKSAPWGWAVLGLGLAAIVTLVRSRDPLLVFTAAWTVAIPIALSLARTKWMWYLTPMYPGAVLFAVALAQKWGSSKRQQGIALGTSPSTTLRASVATIAVAAFAVACEPFVVGAREGETEIKAIAPLVQKEVAPDHSLHTLQLGKVRRSVYPIATLYYTQRRTFAVHSWEELRRVMAGDRRCFHLLLRDTELSAMAAVLPSTALSMERLGQAGDISLVRIRSRQTKRDGDRRGNHYSTVLSAN
jgi:hypothetical protein